MELRETIEDALQCQDSPPPNEACTCDWVIIPILHALGYARRDIVSRVADNNGQFPDYTVLPSSPQHTWYLEAKAWSVRLEDRHAIQSLNYANQNGKRWVVLSNGFVWRLYDNDIRDLASNKMVAEWKLTDEEAVAYFKSLTKESVLADGMENASAGWRLRTVLEASLSDPASPLIRVITDYLRQQSGLKRATPDQVLHFFTGKPIQPVRHLIPQPQPKSTGVIREVRQFAGGQNLQDLCLLAQQGWQKVAFTKPIAIGLPDNTERRVSSWSGVIVELVRWLAENDRLVNYPFKEVSKGHRYVVNTEPVHQNGQPMIDAKPIDLLRHTLYVEANTDTAQKIRQMAALCEAARIEVSSITVIFATG